MDDNFKGNYAGAEDFTAPPDHPEYEYSTYAEQEAKQDNSDVAYVQVDHIGHLPKYYTKDEKTGKITAITREEYGKLRKAQLTRQYQRVPQCGHKFVPGAQPRHRNCEPCWFAFFNVHGEFTQSVEELYAKHGSTPVKRLLGDKVLENFLKFMSTIAAFKAAQEEREKRSQEIKDSFIPPPVQGDVNGNTAGTESSNETIDEDKYTGEGDDYGDDGFNNYGIVENESD